MKFKKWIVALAVAFAASDSIAFSYQTVDLSRVKPAKKTDRTTPVEFIIPQELKAKIEKGEPVFIVDLRAPTGYAQSDKTIKGSLHTKVRKVAYRLREIPREREVVTYCACPADESAALGARALLSSGFKRVRVLKGGWNAWLEAGGQVQPKPRT